MDIWDIPEDKRLMQLAEECAEAAQAALKLIRAHDGEAHLDRSTCRKHLMEELADIQVVRDSILNDLDLVIFANYYAQKKKRWKERLNSGDKS